VLLVIVVHDIGLTCVGPVIDNYPEAWQQILLLRHQLCHIHQVPNQGFVTFVHFAQSRQTIAILWDDQKVHWSLQGIMYKPHS
jgi:hypothetical protein